MELNKLNANQVGASQVSEQHKVQKKSVEGSKDSAAKNPSVAPTGDRVEISNDAAVLARGMEAVKNSPDVRADRVAELKRALQSGAYKVDAKKIAEKMLDSSLEESILSGLKNK